MPAFQSRVRTVDAERFDPNIPADQWPRDVYADATSPTGYSLQPPGDQARIAVPVGWWVMTQPDGAKSLWDDFAFGRDYEEVRAVPVDPRTPDA